MPASQRNDLKTDRHPHPKDQSVKNDYLPQVGLTIFLLNSLLLLNANVATRVLFNVLAAGAVLGFVFAFVFYYRISDLLFLHKISLAIKAESIVPVISQFGDTRYYYDAVLHIGNHTGREIYLKPYFQSTVRGARREIDPQPLVDETSGLIRLSSGDSDIVIDVPIDISAGAQKFPAKPLSLFYRSAGRYHQQSLAVGAHVNQRVQELALSAKPDRPKREFSLA